MRVTYRAHGGSKAYWERRWTQIPADDGALNLERYPGKYAEAVMARVKGEALEAGCGAGRVLLHYRRQGRAIIGMDFIETALQKIRKLEPTTPLYAADVARLPFGDERFDAVLAFGLYHSLESGVDDALRETRRVLRPGGLLCASMRADNLQNRVVDWFAARTMPRHAARQFHKANYTRGEFTRLLEEAGFGIERLDYVENMPFLYKFAFFRHSSHRRFDEHGARGEGYRLSWYGNALQKALMGLFPAAFCNIVVATARAA